MLGLLGNGTEGKDRRERFIVYRHRGEIILTSVLAVIVAGIIYLLLF